jgi:hypothetical protein
MAPSSVAPAAVRDAACADAETPAANVTMYGRVGAGLGEAEGAGLGDAAALGLGEGESGAARLASGEGEGAADGSGDGAGDELGAGDASGLGAGVSLGVGAGESEGAGLTSGDGDGAAEGSGDGAGDELGAGDGLADGSAASAAIGANSDATIKVACRNASARRRRSAGRNPDMLDISLTRSAFGRAGSLGRRRGVGVEVQDEKETMSSGRRNSTNALDGGPWRDGYSVLPRNLPFGLPMVPTVHRESSTRRGFRCLDAPPRIHLARLHRRGAHQTAQDSCPSREGDPPTTRCGEAGTAKRRINVEALAPAPGVRFGARPIERAMETDAGRSRVRARGIPLVIASAAPKRILT